MANHSQSRKWHIVIHNPQHQDLNYDKAVQILLLFQPIYFCLCTEISPEGTEHYHIYLLCKSPVRFTTLKNRFPTGHFEVARGTAVQNRDYLLKEGAYADSPKADTRVQGSFYEWGELPLTAKQERYAPMQELVDDVESGLSTAEIIRKSPNHALRIRHIDELRQTLLDDYYTTHNRDLTVSFLYGPSGVGKTHSVYQRHNPSEVYRLTNYRPGRGLSFDGYSGQAVLVFEEFYGQVPIGEMLNLLDIYPLRLPARYMDKAAVYQTVYLTSNMTLSDLYPEVQKYNPEIFHAFLRRIHHIIGFQEDGSTVERTSEYKDGGNNHV